MQRDVALHKDIALRKLMLSLRFAVCINGSSHTSNGIIDQRLEEQR
jgi:hypothetical protein